MADIPETQSDELELTELFDAFQSFYSKYKSRARVMAYVDNATLANRVEELEKQAARDAAYPNAGDAAQFALLSASTFRHVDDLTFAVRPDFDDPDVILTIVRFTTTMTPEECAKACREWHASYGRFDLSIPQEQVRLKAIPTGV